MYKPIKLEYQTDSLEPFIDTHTVGLHYYKHYLNYLKKLNELLKSINYQFEYPLVLLNYHINEFPQEKKEDILFNLGGVLNHELYFNSISISPKPPKGKLKQKIDIQFGNLENLFSELKKTSLNLKGSGYTFLVVDRDGSLKVINTSNQDSPYFYNLIPLIAIDMWEHAYYINYENKKDLYLDNIFQILDFNVASDMYHQFISRK